MASRSLGTLTLDLIARIGGFQQGMDRASRSVASTGAAADAASARINALQGQFLSLSSVASRIAGPLAAAFSLNSVYQATEAYSTLTNRLKLVTGSSSELAAAQKAVFDIAQASAQPLSSTAELYQRIATNQDALKLSGKEVAGVVGTVSKTLAISGASAESANAALIQLGQAFASGVLRGEELNSVMEQAPALSQAIAAGMGKTVGELRAMGAAGELTSQAVVKAIQSQAGAVDELFAKTATTIGNSFTKISNSMTRFVGEMDQATGASSKVAEEFVGLSRAIDNSLPVSLSAIRENADTLSKLLTAGLYIALGKVASGYAVQAAAALTSVFALRATTAAAAEGAKGDLWAAQAKQIDAKAMLQRADLEIKAAQGKVASDRVRQASELANIKSVQAAITAERLLEQQRLAAQINDTGRAASIARIAEIRLAEVAIIKKVEMAERSLAATTVATSSQVERAYAMRSAAAVAYAETSVVANALAATSAAANAAAASATITARAFGVLAAAGRGLLAMLGGPVGLLFIAGAVTVSFMDFRSSSEKAAQGLEGLKGPLDDVIAKFQQLTRDQKAAAMIRWGEAEAEGIKAAGEEYDKLQKMLKTGLVGPRSSASGTAIFLDYKKKIEEAAAAGKDLSPILEELRSNSQVDPKVVDSLVKRAGAYSEVNASATLARDRINALNGEMNKGVAVTTSATQATKGMTAEGEKYLKTLQSQLGKLQDNNDAVKEASRYISEHKDLSEADKTAIMSAAYASKAQEDANKAATKELKNSTSALSENQKAREADAKAIADTVQRLDLQAKQMGWTSEQIQIYELRTRGATDAQIKGVDASLKTIDAYNKQKEAVEKYKNLVSELRTEQERQTDTLRDQFKVIDEMPNLPTGERSAVVGRALGAATTEAPKFEGIAPEIGGAFGELAKVDDAQAELEKWYSSQLEMLENFRNERKDLSAQFDAEELALKQQHESALAGIERGRQLAQLSAAQSVFGDLAGMAKTFAGEQSGIYKAMFAVQKAASIAQSIVAIQTGIAMASANPFPANLAAMASVAAATASIVGNIGAVGMAHDGMSSIPKEGTWLLDGGERIVTPAQNKDLTNFLARQTAPTVAASGAGGAPQININIKSDGSRGTVESSAGYEQLGEALLATARSEMPKIARQVIQQEKGQNGLLDPSNRRNQ